MASSEGRVKSKGGPWLWPLFMVAVGVVLLLDNFLLLKDFNAVALLPLLLVVAGAQILLRGDFIPSADSRTFGITRGSVESATLEISSGDIDVEIYALQREGRLVAGQFAGGARPYLRVDGSYAHLKMERSKTRWMSFVDWQVGITQDLPWQILLSASLGRAVVDLTGVVVHDVVIATGFGDIRFTAPKEALGQIYLRSALGNMHLTTPPGYQVHVTIEPGWFFKVKHDPYRYKQVEEYVFAAADFDEDAPLVEIRLSGSFGDAYLA